MKLIIQIPCFNEEQTLPAALSCLPRTIHGVDAVEWLIIDDGSADNTAAVAKANGVDHIVRHIQNKGLAAAFMTGIDACLERGADIIVNTDADNQYEAADIPALIKPILENRAELVIGARPIDTIEHFSPIKKFLQKLGSWVVRSVSRTKVPDAPSGFRAMSRDAACRMVVFSNYTYTLETIIQAGQKNITIASVPVRINKDLRPSRLFKSIPSYICRSIATMLRIFVIYRPFRFFATLGMTLFAVGFLIGLRFVYFYLTGDGSGHIQSLILSGVLLGMGFQTILVAFLADLIAANRRILEDLRYTARRGSVSLASEKHASQTGAAHSLARSVDFAHELSKQRSPG
ncbi:glycosyltransferase family 2 protein [Saliniramus fredricksonii]|uniref:Glycosyltransferase involved in cell wall bisynthesis n=1 Tax=Saliniramus fredricksonii TaxID=1653334 RepID=A0ABY0K669_9HYPH|nr:glycosyltransferase family 2 protein [Saliniramus fredricksonii]SCC79447.1 Glycosyltransferase involved in cell wall bisynthesis [Saliniramus fredricksonii]